MTGSAIPETLDPMAVAVAATVPAAKAATMLPVPWNLANGDCMVARLPIDETIARAARLHATAPLVRIGLPRDAIDNVASMVSELATNALQHGGDRDDEGHRAQHDTAELWMYQRSAARGPELVVKVFDTFRGWRIREAETDEDELPEHNRGLSIVETLSEGRCGHHPTRSRQCVPAVPGKAGWFALPFPEPGPSVGQQSWNLTPAHAVERLHSLLAARGVGPLIYKHELRVSVLSVARHITLWCRDRQFSWSTPDRRTVRLPVGDLTEACEQLIHLHELMADDPAKSGS